MADFVCKVSDARGRVSTQVENADSAAEARQRLVERGLFVYSVRNKALPSLSIARPRRVRRISADEFLLFNQQLVTLIRAGLPILRAVDLLAERAARPVLRAALDEVRKRVRGGDPLSVAMRSTGVFSDVYTTAVLAGERSGNLVEVLEQYVAYQKVTGAARRRLLTALVYPAFLILVSIAVLSYVTAYVIPRFSQLYEELGMELPSLTVLVINFALQIRSSFLLFLFVAVLLVGALFMFGQSEAGARTLDKIRMGIPLVGDVSRKFRVAQFCRTMATLLSGGIPLVASLETAAGAMASPVLRHAVTVTARRVREGQAMHAALEETGVFPGLITEMTEVGEATGALPAMLNSSAEFYEEELNAKLNALLSLVEPLLLLVVAGTVLVILIALYLPIFSVGGAAR